MPPATGRFQISIFVLLFKILGRGHPPVQPNPRHAFFLTRPRRFAGFLPTARRFFARLFFAGLAAAALAFALIPGAAAITFVSRAGYWLVLAAFACWVWALLRTFRPDLRADAWRRIDPFGAALVAAGGTVLLAHEAFGFKIIMDEIMLLGTSMSMHFERVVQTPLDRKSTRLNSSHVKRSRMPSSA